MNLLVAVLLLTIFAEFTLLVGIVDVGAVGPANTKVGFSTINQQFFEMFSIDICYTITQVLGYVSIGIMFGFACFGAMQIVKNKGFKGVNPNLYFLAITYLLLIATYVLFENFVINYRPTLGVGGVLEASYPSSHAMLIVVVFLTAGIAISRMCNNKKLKVVLSVFCPLIAIGATIARLFSGVHWLTDIIGGVLVGLTLVAFFNALSLLVVKEKVEDEAVKQKQILDAKTEALAGPVVSSDLTISTQVAKVEKKETTKKSKVAKKEIAQPKPKVAVKEKAVEQKPTEKQSVQKPKQIKAKKEVAKEGFANACKPRA